jgi:phenylalanyl-tRNA synthetase beta chain
MYSVEPVDVIYPDGRTLRYPDLSAYTIDASVDYINGCIGVQLTSDQIINYLQRMGLDATTPSDQRVITASIPPTRSDILHACDIMEDVAIAYGYNQIKRIFPNTNTIAAPLPINKLSDQIRREFALSGWTEVLPLILVSNK